MDVVKVPPSYMLVLGVVKVPLVVGVVKLPPQKLFVMKIFVFKKSLKEGQKKI